LIGLAAGIIKSLYKLTAFDIKVEQSPDNEKDINLTIVGNLTFLRLPQIAEIIENIEPGKNVTIKFKHLNTADHAIIDLLIGWAERYSINGKVFIDWEFLKKIYPNFGWGHLKTELLQSKQLPYLNPIR
jgi:ABC-type transporter Mla MlaB component